MDRWIDDGRGITPCLVAIYSLPGCLHGSTLEDDSLIILTVIGWHSIEGVKLLDGLGCCVRKIGDFTI